MASHHLTIAKATFAASLMRPDVTKINRDEASQFQDMLEQAVMICSSQHIQTCKQWLSQHVLPSTPRTTAFLRFVTALAKNPRAPESGLSKTSVSRQRLHLLYLLNDLLHHSAHHASPPASQESLSQSCQPYVLALFQLAAAEQRPKVCQRLRDLVELWSRSQYVDKEIFSQIQEIIKDPASTITTRHPAPTVSAEKEPPFLMPSTHGDPSLPFYEWPAGNLMPHIVPNKPMAMHPASIRPLQFTAGPADESLVQAVQDFLDQVEKIDDPFARLEDEGIVPDIDEMGQLSYRNEDGELIGDTYYGWSRDFCRKMKSRSEGGSNGAAQRSRSRSSSSSRSRSRSPRKRRRYSDDSHGRSLSRSLSRSPNRQRLSSYRSRSRSRSYSPPARFQQSRPQGSNGKIPFQQASNSNPAQHQFTTPQAPGMPHSSFQPPPLGSGGLSIPPPMPAPPPGWGNRPWPPPPPPITTPRDGFKAASFPVVAGEMQNQGGQYNRPAHGPGGAYSRQYPR